MDWAGPSVLPQKRQQQLPKDSANVLSYAPCHVRATTCCREYWEAVAKYDQEVVEMLLVACRSSLNTNQLCDSGDAMME